MQYPTRWANIGPDHCRFQPKTEGGEWRQVDVPPGYYGSNDDIGEL